MVGQAPVRFRYGRHETFAVRYGWLTKGTRHVEARGELSASLDTADTLGLGSKMVQSLQFWVEATGLVEGVERPGAQDRRQLTPLGELVWAHDPFMEYPATWWFLHLSLCEPLRVFRRLFVLGQAARAWSPTWV